MLIDKETLIKMRERHDRRSRRALERYEISGLQVIAWMPMPEAYEP